jgi:hypothetical protein
MTRAVTAWVLSIGSVVTLAIQEGRGQPPSNPYLRQPTGGYVKPPQLSPYLNLFRSGSPSANFYYNVMPYENRGFDNPLNSRLQEWDRRVGTNADLEELIPTLPGTGHPAGFMTMSPYFGSQLGNYSSTPRYNINSQR